MKKKGFLLFIPLLVFTALPAKDTDGGMRASITRQKLAADAANVVAAGSRQLRQRPISREKAVSYPFLGELRIRKPGDASRFQVLGTAGIIPVEITDVSGTAISEYVVGDTIVITITYGDSVWIEPYVDDGDGIFDKETDFYFAPDDPKDGEEGIIIKDGDDDDEDDATGVWQITFDTGKSDEGDILFSLQGVKIFFSLFNNDSTDTGLDTLDVLPLVSTTSLSGKVTKFDASPAPNMVMVAFPEQTMKMEGPPESLFITVTDATGDYTLFLEDDAADIGFTLFTFDLLRQYGGLFPDPLMVKQLVASGDSLINLDFVLVEPTAIISGVLTDELDSPIADVCILAGIGEGPFEAEATTDVDGKYEIPVISGWWHVRPEEDDLIELGYMVPHGKEDLDISDDDTLVVNFVAYAANATVTGNVTKDGTSLPGLEIGAWGEPVGYTFTESGADGSYTLQVSSEVDVRGYNIWPEDMPPQTYFAEKLWDIQPNATGVNINLLTATGGISGVVTDIISGDALYKDVGIMVWDTTSGAEYHTGVEWETGNYRIYLPAGVYELMAFSHEYFPYHYGPITVSGSVVAHNIALSPIVLDATISGTLKDDHANPIAGVRIFAGADFPFRKEDTTDAAGAYSLPVFTGRWHVHPSAEDLIDRDYLVPHGKDDYEVAAGASITVDFDTYATDDSISGTVKWVDDDSAVDYAEIHGDSPAGYFSRVRTGSDGTYALPVSTKLDSIEITDEHGTWKTQGYEINVETRDALSQPPGHREVYSGDTGVDFTMYPADAFLSGHISDQNGNPVPRVDLHAFTIGSTLEFHTGSGTEYGGFYEMPLLGGHTWVVEVFFPELHDSTALTDTIDVVSGSNVVKDYTLTLLSTIGPRDGGNLPVDFALYQNYPNPFNPSTTIAYQLAEAGQVSLVVYDLTGNVVSTLVNESQTAGYYQTVWNGRDRRGVPVATGVYFYRLKAGTEFVKTHKMVLMK